MVAKTDSCLKNIIFFLMLLVLQIRFENADPVFKRTGVLL